MSPSSKQVLETVSQLTATEREEVLELLLTAEDVVGPETLSAEIERRLAAVEAGLETTEDFEEALTEIRRGR
jgi:hypothetical protein